MDNWIITIASSATDNIIYNRFKGSRDEVKAFLINLLNKDKSINDKNFEHGTNTIEEIDDNGTELKAYATYSDHRIEYTAMTANDAVLRMVSNNTRTYFHVNPNHIL